MARAVLSRTFALGKRNAVNVSGTEPAKCRLIFAFHPPVLLVEVIERQAPERMGIIDTTHFTITCPKCGIIESLSVHEKGSAYSSSWQDGAEAKNFILTWTGGDKVEPKITSAKCRACGSEAMAR